MKPKTSNVLIAAVLLALCAGCVSNKYPGINPDGTQRQPWDDTPTFWPYHWTCTKEGKHLKAWNAQMEQFYMTNSIQHEQ